MIIEFKDSDPNLYDFLVNNGGTFKSGKWNFVPSCKLIAKLKEKNIKISEDILKKYESNEIKKSTYKPYWYQKELVEFFKTTHRCLFLCDVGLGKTKAAIDSLISINAKKILYISPSPVMLNAYEQICEHSNYDPVVLTGTMDRRLQLLNSDNYDIYIINYEMLDKIEYFIKQANFDAFIIDEIHKCKNGRAKQSKALESITKGNKYKIGLTGTFISNGVQDVFHIAKCIDPSHFGTNYYAFRSYYLIMGGFQDKVIVGSKNKDNFQAKLSKFAIKFTADDADDLPDVLEIPTYIELSDKSRAYYDKVKTMVKEEIDELGDKYISDMGFLERLVHLKKTTSGKHEDFESDEKISVLKEKLEQVIQEGNKAIIWANYYETFDYLGEKLKSDYKVCFLNGKSDKSIISEFEKTDKYQVMIANLQMGAGWEIPSCKYSFFYDLNYSQSDLIQGKGRTRRSGSKLKKVVYYYLICRDTIDQAIFETLKNKEFTAKEALAYVTGGRK